MEITQLLVAAGSTLGIALVGVMAIIPSVMEARAAGGSASSTPPVPTPLRPRHHLFHRPHHGRLADLAA
jgi:hypothetical protein